MAALSDEGRRALIDALIGAKNREGASLLRTALGRTNNDAALRLTAAAGLGDLGTAKDASALIALLGQPDDALADAARMSLIKLADAATDDAVVRALRKNEGDAACRVRLIGVALFRKTPAPPLG
jgi:thioredoxin-like negative regulator of GroEL